MLAGAVSLVSGPFAGATAAEAKTGVVRVKLETALGLIEVAADCARAALRWRLPEVHRPALFQAGG
jgi:hypothetical protein